MPRKKKTKPEPKQPEELQEEVFIETTNDLEPEPVNEIANQIYIPSSSTLIDIACTDTTKGFCTAGHTVNIVGDPNSGKTMIATASMAETFYKLMGYFRNKFRDFEQAMSFDLAGLFGQPFADSFEHLLPEHTLEWSIEATANSIISECAKGPCFEIIDSVDGMLAEEEIKMIMAGKAIERSAWGGPRAKAMTQFYRSVCPAIAKSGSFLIVLSQAKDNMGFGAQFKPKTRYGGKSLAFYAYVEMWLARTGSLKVDKTVIGSTNAAKIERSKVNGKRRIAEFSILPAYGVDNTRSCIDWLIKEGAVGKKKGASKVDLNPIGIPYFGTEPYLYVEEHDRLDDVVEATRVQWAKNEAEYIKKAFGGRKPRYA